MTPLLKHLRTFSSILAPDDSKTVHHFLLTKETITTPHQLFLCVIRLALLVSVPSVWERTNHHTPSALSLSGWLYESLSPLFEKETITTPHQLFLWVTGSLSLCPLCLRKKQSPHPISSFSDWLALCSLHTMAVYSFTHIMFHNLFLPLARNMILCHNRYEWNVKLKTHVRKISLETVITTV